MIQLMWALANDWWYIYMDRNEKCINLNGGGKWDVANRERPISRIWWFLHLAKPFCLEKLWRWVELRCSDSVW
jgi:hypothetical protein